MYISAVHGFRLWPARGGPARLQGGGEVRRRLAALMRKEFIQVVRDRRTLAMMILIPFLWLLIFGYAATFDVRHMRTAVGGPQGSPLPGLIAQVLRTQAAEYFEVVDTSSTSREEIEEKIRTGEAQVAILAPAGAGEAGLVLVDGSEIFTAQTAARQIQAVVQKLATSLAGNPVTGSTGSTGSPAPALNYTTEILYNPHLRSANVMIPGLVGLVMVFIATIMTAVGVVREKERGTLEQLMVTPLGPLELMVGKIVPYILIAFVDLLIVVGAGVWIFDVPFAGSPLLLFGLSLFFLITCLGIGLLISTVSQTQQQALQMAVFTLVPRILISGFIFPLSAIPWAVRWVAYVAPLTYFLPIARGTFLKDVGLGELWVEAVVLAAYSVVVITLAALRFRRRLL